MRCASPWGAGSDLRAKQRLDASGRDEVVFIALSPVLARSPAKAFFILSSPFPGPKPAACAQVGVVLGG